MRDDIPDRLFDPGLDGDADREWSALESRIRSVLFEDRVSKHPGWLLELAADWPNDDVAAEVAADEEEVEVEPGVELDVVVEPENGPAGSFSVEAELSRFSDDIRPARAGLRFELLIELDRWEQRRLHFRRVTVAVAFLVTAALSILVPLHSAPGQPAVEQTVSTRSSSPLDVFRGQSSLPPLLAGNSGTDNWALVDAYSEFEVERRARLRRGLTGSLLASHLLRSRETE